MATQVVAHFAMNERTWLFGLWAWTWLWTLFWAWIWSGLGHRKGSVLPFMLSGKRRRRLRSALALHLRALLAWPLVPHAACLMIHATSHPLIQELGKKYFTLFKNII